MSVAPEIVQGLIDQVISLDGLRFQLAVTAALPDASGCVHANCAQAIEAAHDLEDALRGLLAGCMGEHLPPPPEPEPVEACLLEIEVDDLPET